VDVSREQLIDLLELQKIDSTIDRLEARRRSLPEQAELEKLEDRLSEVEAAFAEQQAIVDEISAQQRKLEGDIEIVSTKIQKDEARLYSGEFTNPKELTDLQGEVESLRRRKSSLEDQDLEVMERKEEAEKVLSPLVEQIEQLRQAIAEATERRDRAAGETQTQLEAARAEREHWPPKFDPELLELYDNLRGAKGGVGAAALIDGTCQGCHMRLPSQEFERVRASQGLVFCDDCRRILVVIEEPQRSSAGAAGA
jgi:predicted  nucleic acid-binding Zn-ribbon protein